MAEGFKNTLNPLKTRLIRLDQEVIQIDFLVQNEDLNRKNELIRMAESYIEKYGDTFTAINEIDFEWLQLKRYQNLGSIIHLPAEQKRGYLRTWKTRVT